MNFSLPGILALLAFIVSAIFTYHVAYRWWVSRHVFMLFWAIGLGLFSIAALLDAEGLLIGPSIGAFMLYMLVTAANVAFLGLGTIYLLTPRKFAYACTVIFLGLTGWLAYNIYGTPACTYDPLIAIKFNATACPDYFDSVRILNEQQVWQKLGYASYPGLAVVATYAPDRIRGDHALLDIPGSFALILGALWSAFVFLRRRQHRERVIGNVLIAVGAFAIAGAGTLSRFGIPGLQYGGELIAAALMYAGFIVIGRAPRPTVVPAGETAVNTPIPAETGPETIPETSSGAADLPSINPGNEASPGAAATPREP